MKTLARVALTPGMEIGENIYSFKDELLIPADTVLTEALINKLTRHNIVCVSVKDSSDYARTHFERIRFSEGFRNFEEIYNECMAAFKKIMVDFVEHQIAPDMDALMNIYTRIRKCAHTGEQLLDYLYNLLPSEDEMTHAHCLNSALIAGVFGIWLGLPDADIDILIQSGFFYDIGKLKLPDKLLWKPGKLSDFEYNWVKTHTTIGYDMIKDLHLNEHVLNATLMHHERCDGSGYPKKLTGENIDIFALYMGIVDSYEAMTSARSYRPTLIPFQVIENFERTGYEKYGAGIIMSIMEHIANTQLGMTVRLSDDRTADVLLTNRNALTRPLVKCGEELIDLTSRPDLKITAVL
ncbi:MAG: HD domain-containing protein [Clostridiales bacterium]|nr:HD domain-containing protein [Clostridiales bacterium]